jgi:hypothetical protein
MSIAQSSVLEDLLADPDDWELELLSRIPESPTLFFTPSLDDTNVNWDPYVVGRSVRDPKMHSPPASPSKYAGMGQKFMKAHVGKASSPEIAPPPLRLDYLSNRVDSPTTRALDIEAELTRQSLYKTELCRNWTQTGACRYGPKCQFAHGAQELRGVVRHPKYKTEICRTFHTTGVCGYGQRCRFVHHVDEMRNSGEDPSETFRLYNIMRENAELNPISDFDLDFDSLVISDH